LASTGGWVESVRPEWHLEKSVCPVRPFFRQQEEKVAVPCVHSDCTHGGFRKMLIAH